MDKRVFLATWKDIPAANEVQYEIKDVQHSSGTNRTELENGAVFWLKLEESVYGQDSFTDSYMIVRRLPRICKTALSTFLRRTVDSAVQLDPFSRQRLIFRHGVAEAAQQQRVHDSETQRGGAGHAVPVDEADERNLGARGAQDSAGQRHVPGEAVFRLCWGSLCQMSF